MVYEQIGQDIFADLKKRINELDAEIIALKGHVNTLQKDLRGVPETQRQVISSELAKGRRDFAEFRKLLLESARELINELELKRTAAVRREIARIDATAARTLKAEIARTKEAEFKRYTEKYLAHTDKRLGAIEEVLHTKVATSAAVDKKLSILKAEITDGLEAQVDKEMAKVVDRSGIENAKESVLAAIKPIRDQVIAINSGHKKLQEGLADIIGTVSELHEDMDNMKEQTKQEILSTARRLTDDEDSDIAALIGQIGELRAAMKKMRKVSFGEGRIGR